MTAYIVPNEQYITTNARCPKCGCRMLIMPPRLNPKCFGPSGIGGCGYKRTIKPKDTP